MTQQKTNTIIYLLFLLGFLCVSQRIHAQEDTNIIEIDTTVASSLRPIQEAGDSITSSLVESSDTTKLTVEPTDTLQKEGKKEALDAPVFYTSTDSIVWTKGGNAYLYGDGKVNYQDIELKAEVITMNIDSSTVYAQGVTDSLGVKSGTPVFSDGSTPYESEKMSYNFKSKKGFINNVVTQQGEGYVVSEDAKKDAEGVFYVQHGKYTTCDNHDHPHFYFALTRAKIRPKKNVVFGPAYLVVEDVPLPLAIPFGFFPFSSSYSSGFIMPSYGDETDRGFYLRDGGYYFAFSDYLDMKLTGEIFTKGSWGINAASSYVKRYRYSGSFNMSYLVTKTGERNMPDYAESKDFKIQWSHRQDAKASPNSNFSASVNFATSSYEKSNLNSLYNPSLSSQSIRTSSVSYSRSFPNQNLTISGTFNLSQNVRDSTIALTLPSLNISLSRIYPFKRKKAAGDERWYEKISFSYTGTLSNSINTQESMLFKSNLIKDWTNGMKHSIPVSATFSAFNYINITPSISYTERWYTHKVNQSWDDDAYSVRRDTVYGFNRVYDYSMSVSANTMLYGFYQPIPSIFGDKVQMIRHVFKPSVSFSYTPDFGASRYGYYETYTYTDRNGEVQTVEYSPYTGSLYGVPSQGKTGNVSFDISNNVEMKIKSDKDTTGIRKISLIDELGASISYNLAAKTKPWSNLSTRLRLKLTKSYTFSLNASWATYAYQFNEKGQVVVGDRTEWSYGRFGRFQGMSQNISYTFNNGTWKKWFGKKDEKATAETSDEDVEIEEESVPVQDSNMDPDANNNKKKGENAASELDEDGYMAFSIPWSFSISYGITMRENTAAQINIKNMRYPYKFTQNMNFSGNIQIANGWNFAYSSGYDFENHQLTTTTMNVSRDLHCFTMSCSVVLHPYTSFNFSIRATSAMLADALKFDKRSSASSNIEWY